MCYKNKVTMIGYWHPIHPSDINTTTIQFPDPRKLVDVSWCPDSRDQIINYLKNAIVYCTEMDYAYNRFTNLRDEDMGCRELTDGIWMWPEGLYVYVEKYKIKLPEEFVSHMKANDFVVPSNIDDSLQDVYAVNFDFSFWIKWGKPYLK